MSQLYITLMRRTFLFSCHKFIEHNKGVEFNIFVRCCKISIWKKLLMREVCPTELVGTCHKTQHMDHCSGTHMDDLSWWIFFRQIMNMTDKKKLHGLSPRTIPTERPPLVGEVSANFRGWRAPRIQRDRSLQPYSRISWWEPLFFSCK
jgi:hypothetical protein